MKVPIRSIAALCAPFLLAACAVAQSATGAGPRPIVRQQRLAPMRGSLERIAIVPLVPELDSSGAPLRDTRDARDARETADLVSRYLSEALVAAGLRVVPPGDVRLALRGAGIEDPRVDPLAAAGVAEQKFGATSVMLGALKRYRDREGRGGAAAHPASVDFELQLYAAADGKPLWTGRFNHTQQSLDHRPREGLRYPGRGLRWLTAAELAQWGAQNVATSLAARP